jgi:hypothetical protein
MGRSSGQTAGPSTAPLAMKLGEAALRMTILISYFFDLLFLGR